MKKLTEEFLKHVGDYMLVETPLAQADVCLVFGNSHADHLAEHAADLYHQGYFSLVVVSGGVVTDDGRLEAHRMRDVLVARGVPESHIIVEDKARNCGENAIFSMRALEEKIGLKSIDSVLAIGHIHASRRFLMTLERHWPDVVKMFSTQNCYGGNKHEWHLNPKFKEAVLREYEKVPEYKTLDFIREIDLDRAASKISALRKPGGSHPHP